MAGGLGAGLGCLASRIPPDRPADGEEILRMIFLGLVIALAAVVVGTAVVLDDTGEAQLTLFGDGVPGVTEQWHVFMAGAVVAIVFVAGAGVAALGYKRAIGMRRELRDLRDEHEQSLQTLEMERRKLQQALAQARREMDEAPVPAQRVAPS
ncbi:DUF6338 family protein [Actinomadura litoris]|uniref:DUF6338 family protein n=1 Tax=Actinomadura litoris TaxID=2678616 RepID=UPI0028AB085B|nr:DUF6338 family protein [Actinomadura litoris]